MESHGKTQQVGGNVSLAYQRQSAVLRRIDGLDRNDTCIAYQKKVMLLARRVVERLPSDTPIQYDDLVSYGSIGLLEAFDRYDGSRGIKFSTYAEYRIRGAMLDALRSNDTFTRRRRQLAKRIDHATTSLRLELGREPEPQEVADAMGVDLDDYWSSLDRVTPVNVVSLDYRIEDGDEGRTLLDQLPGDSDLPDHGRNVADVRGALRDAIKALPERERHCVLMYYGKEMSLAEIGQVFEVTPSRISQILSKARGTLRKKLMGKVGMADLEFLDG